MSIFNILKVSLVQLVFMLKLYVVMAPVACFALPNKYFSSFFIVLVLMCVTEIVEIMLNVYQGLLTAI